MTAGKSSKPFKIKRGNLNSFLFFLFLATLFWVLTKFSKEYVSEVVTSIKYLNVPEGTIVQGDSVQDIQLSLSASGFEFMFYKLKTPKVPVDLSTINPDANQSWILTKSELEDLASKAFKHPVTAKVPESGLILALDALGKHKVPVRSALRFVLQDGYQITDSISIEPDSVTFIGPKNDLIDLNFATTIAKEFESVNSSINGTVNIAMPEGFEQLTIVPEEVTYSLGVDQFIEAELLIPVQLVNAPEGSNIELFPSSIKVKYQISFKNYKDVVPGDFKIVCDMAQIDEARNILIPKLTGIPAGVTQAKMGTNQVEFIFIQ